MPGRRKGVPAPNSPNYVLSSMPNEVTIGLLGCGTVGAAVLRLLDENKEYIPYFEWESL